MDKLIIIFWFLIKILKFVITVFAIALLVWFLLSYIEVITHNLEKFPQYSNWNFFEIIF